GALVERHRRKTYFAALAWIGDREEALDISQEAFARAFQALPRFDTRYPFYPWIYRIVRNLCFSLLRKSGTKRPLSLSRGAEDAAREEGVPDARCDPGALATRTELSENVWKAINPLRPNDRKIAVLNPSLEQSYQEIAEAPRIPVGTVMPRLYSARQRLKE